MMFLEKVIVSLLSTFIFSLSLTVVEQIGEQQQDGFNYFSLGLFIIYCVYSFPIYLIGGGFYSYLVDVFFYKNQFRNEFLKYIIELLLYVAGGLLVIGILLMVMLIVYGNLDGLLITKSFVIGTLASVLFYHISLIFKKVLKFAER